MNNAQKIVRVVGLGLVLTAFSAGAAQAAAGSGSRQMGAQHTGITCVDGGTAAAEGGTVDSGGLLSGDVVEVPVNAPVEACGNQISLLGILDSVR